MVDPLFFAEEFAARRRRYIRVRVDIKKIALNPVYKNYSFPFITGTGSESLTDYPGLFKDVLEASFRQPDDRYVPTTRFEALSLELYKQEAVRADGVNAGIIEKIRVRFVESLVKPNAAVDLLSLRSSPHSPKSGPFSASNGRAPLILSSHSSVVSQSDLRPPQQAFYNRRLSNFIQYELDKYLSQTGKKTINITDAVVYEQLFRDQIFLLHTWSQALPGNAVVNSFVEKMDNRLRNYSTELRRLLQDFDDDDDKLNKIFYLAAAINVTILKNLNGVPGPDNNPELFRQLDARIIALRQPGGVEFPADVTDAEITMPPRGFDNGAARPPYIIQAFGQDTRLVTDDQFNAAVQDLSETIMSVDRDIESLLPYPTTRSLNQEYLTPDFVNYLTSLASGRVLEGRPPGVTRCEDILFQGSPNTPPSDPDVVYIDMLPFIQILIPNKFGSNTDKEVTSSFRIDRKTPLWANRRNVCPIPTDNPNHITITSPTIQAAYDELKQMRGTPLERYFQFIRFVYIFFDHIPTAQGSIAALLKPLVGMRAGILGRGGLSPELTSKIMNLLTYTPDNIQANTTFHFAHIAFEVASTARDEAARSILHMYQYYPTVINAIKCLLRAGSDKPGEFVVEIKGTDQPYQQPMNLQFTLDDLLKIPIEGKSPYQGQDDRQRAYKIYQESGISEFNLPTGGIHRTQMILPRILGIPSTDIISRIYNLCTYWPATQQEYDKDRLSIARNPDLISQFRSYSQGRIAYTVESKFTPSPNPDFTFVKVQKFSSTLNPAVPRYLEPWYNRDKSPFHNAFSVEEFLYPALTSYLIGEQEIVRDIAETMIRPCLQLPDTDIVFPSTPDLIDGLVTADGFDIEAASTDIIAAIFEFPVTTVNVIFPKASGGVPPGPNLTMIQGFFPGVFTLSSTTGFSVNRGGGSRDGKFVYYLTDALNLTDIILPITARTKAPVTQSFFPLGDILKKRTKFAWSALPLAAYAPPKGPNAPLQFCSPADGRCRLFLPALNTEVFLSSFFDWKLQLYYLADLLQFLEGRNVYGDIVRKSIIGFFDKLDKEVITSILPKTRDESAVQYYIKENTITNLIIQSQATDKSSTASFPYTGFRNLVYSIAGPEASSSLTDIILNNENIIASSELTLDTRKFYTRQAPVEERGPLIYDISIDNYITLAGQRNLNKPFTSLAEKPTEKGLRVLQQAETQRNLDLSILLKRSGVRLRGDPYSILVNEIATRALFPR